MLARVLLLLALVASITIVITVVAAVLLGLGTALALVFSVTVWEATVVVMVAAVGTVWLLLNVVLPPADLPDLPDESEEPAVYVTNLPLPRSRGSRKRRR